MKKLYVLFCMFLSVFIIGCNQPVKTDVSWWAKACIENNCFDIKIADNDQERQKWLMNVETMPEFSWMLFIFQNTGVYSFWMKNTLIPLDIIWIDENWKIVYIKENAQPCKTPKCETYDPWVAAKYVLELNWGLSAKYNIKIWKNITIPK